MADEIKKKILIDVEAKTETLKKNAVELNATLDGMKSKLKEVELASGKNSIAYQDQASKIRLTQEAIRANNRELDAATKALTSQGNSIAQNRALVATLTAEHIKLSQAEGASSAAAMDMQAKLASVNEVLKKQTTAYGDHRLEVGNYKIATEGLTTKLSGAEGGFQKLTDTMKGTAGGFGFMPQALSNITGPLSQFVNVQRTVIQGFQQHIGLVQEDAAAQEALTVAQINSTTAAEADTIAQAKLAAGEITEAEAAAVATTAIEAKTVATEAQTVATATSTAVTESATTGLKLLRIAFASTGIGLLIIALGSLVAYFTQSNEGSKKLQVIMAAINSVVQVGYKAFATLGKNLFDAVTSPVESLKKLGSLIVDNIVNRFKSISVILDGIIHLDFQKVANGVIQAFTGVTDGTTKIANAGKAVLDFGKNAVQAAKDAGAVTVERQKLNKEERLWSEEKTKQQGILDKLKLQIRDQSKTDKERIEIAKQAKSVSDGIFQNDLKHAEENAKIVQKEQDLKSKKDYQAITDAKNRVQQLKNAHDVELQSIQNREARVEKSLVKEGKAYADLQQKIREAMSESEKVRMESLTRQLQATFDSYAAELIGQDQHFNEEIAKQKAQQDKKMITLSQYNRVKEQLENEHHSKVSDIIKKFQDQDADTVLKYQNDIAAMQIQAIENSTQKQVLTLEQQGAEKLYALDKETVELEALNKKQLTGITYLKDQGRKEEAESLEKSNQATFAKLTLLKNKRILIEKQTNEAIAKVKKEDALRAASDADSIAVIKTSKPGKEKDHLVAVRTQLMHEYFLKIAAEQKLGHDTALLKAEFRQKDDELQKDYQQKQTERFLQYTKLAQDFAFNILSQANQRSSNAKLASLGAQKDAELRNTSLTAGQKSAIEAKYAKKEQQEKIKAFKAEQRLNIAQAIINGLLAMVKTSANVGFPLSFAFSPIVAAQTAFAVAGIAAQKPAFATGGKFISDGKGSLVHGPGTGTSDSINSRLSHGESVINARSTAMFSPLLSAINAAGGGRAWETPQFGRAFLSTNAFAAGGVYSQNATYLPTLDNGLRLNQPLQINQTGGEINYEKLIGGFSEAVSQLPAPILDVKDVNYAQQIMTNVSNRVNL